MPFTVDCKDPAPLEKILKQYAAGIALENTAAQVVARGLSLVGVGLRPILDHFIFRTVHLKERTGEFLEMGYERDPTAKVLEHKGHSVEVFRKGCAPAILVEHPHEKTGLEWVAHFGDKKPYAMALRVDDIEEAAFHLEKQSVGFLRPPAGKHGETLREIAALPEVKDGKNAHHLILVERHAGDQRFYSPDFWIKI
jgi:4-hydroxyphenylpyruvate dioxygenase-like putative hemolysin